MKLVKTISEMREIHTLDRNAKVILVPTMGALHDGHRELIREARKAVTSKGIVVVSVFVNPTQFDQSTDFENYPSTLDADLEKCQQDGVDVVFAPSPEEVYYDDASIKVLEGSLSKNLCGATREGHFDGVCLVVLKLYNIVCPQIMVFGEKDFQQVAIVRRMVRDLNLLVEILEVDTVREGSGLAMSSRNLNLTNDARQEAAVIHKTLLATKIGLETGTLKSLKIAAFFEEAFSKVTTNTKVDYLDLVHPETLEKTQLGDKKAVLAIAVFFDQVRLIDHIAIDLPEI